MKSLFLFFLVLLATMARSQEQAGGLEENDTGYDSIETANMLYGAELNAVTPERFSMRMYCPVSPVAASGGLTWTAAISKAMSIQWGYKQHWNREQIESQSFSPYFLFDLLPKASSESCQLQKNWMKQTQDLLMTIGNVKLSDYKQGSADCHRPPPKEMLNTVDRFPIRAMTKLFVNEQSDESSSIGQKQFVMKRSLGRKHPVVMCIMGDKGFAALQSDRWVPGSPMKELQVVVVVGYDDQKQAFEVAHPTGKNWGKGGFAWIRYADLIHARYALEITMEDQPKPGTRPRNSKTESKKATPGPDISSKTQLQGSLVLNTVNPDGNYIPVALDWNTKGYYEPLKSYAVFSQFQMLGTGTTNSYLYVFSVDPNGKAQLHYPYQKNYSADVSEISSAMVAEPQSQVVIPEPVLTYDVNGNQFRREQVFIKEQPGTDWLVSLYSERRLDQEIRALIRDLDGHNIDFLSRFQQVFGKYLAPKSLVTLEKDLMKFKTGALPKALVVPVILKIDGN